MSELEARTRYDPSEVEPRIAEAWLASGIFHAVPEGTPEENYSIAIPPPNVTGVLHLGHALNASLQDTLIRHARARGRRAKWVLGTDHAGIATQTKVEQLLRSEGTSRKALGRERFVERVWEWRREYGGAMISQLKRLGASLDYAEERFTLDPAYARAVTRVFVAMYEKGYIYRDRYIVNWDPGSGSAVSDLEVVSERVTDTLYYIDYPLAGGSGAITVATVRPETMLADSAIAVHPDDERYRRLIGETAILPLVGRKLKIIADEHVRPDFGTGALKITPAHDPNDFEIGRRHSLAQPSVIGEDGRITDEAPEAYRGLTVAEAQQRVVAELDELGLLARSEPYEHEVPFSERSGARIEPLISLQWFMRMEELAAPAIAAVRDGTVRFHPDGSKKIFLDWMENIRPWCVSRQLWWGHQLPVWYRDLETYVGTEPPRGEGWTRDPDVLDTWFSSALWPFATLGWPEQTPELAAFYPTDVLSTAREIINLWVARMLMMGLEFTGELPFTDVNIHSVIQAPDGRRMSKSLGTGVDPVELIDGGPRPPVFAATAAGRGTQGTGDFPAYGADALRWGLLAMSSGQDVRFSEDKVAQGQQLANKLWNASRLILLSIPDDARAAAEPARPEDRWILSRLERLRGTLEDHIAAFDLPHAALALYDFVYGELCDWYLELVKPRLRAGEPALRATLLHVLTETLSLAHPMIPFVTEEIWSFVPGAEGLLAARVRPEGAVGDSDPAAEAALDGVIGAVTAMRSWRSSTGVRPAAALHARLRADGYADTAQDVARLARLTFTAGSANGAGEVAATVPVPGGTIEILPGGDLDLGAAERRRDAERERLRAEISRAEGKLANPGFVDRAPAAVVDAEREKLARLVVELEAL